MDHDGHEQSESGNPPTPEADGQGGVEHDLRDVEQAGPEGAEPEVVPTESAGAWAEGGADAVDPEPASPEAIAEAGDPWAAPAWEQADELVAGHDREHAEADSLGGELRAVDDEARENTEWLKLLADSAAAAGTGGEVGDLAAEAGWDDPGVDGPGAEGEHDGDGRTPTDAICEETEPAAWTEARNELAPAQDETGDVIGRESTWEPLVSEVRNDEPAGGPESGSWAELADEQAEGESVRPEANREGDETWSGPSWEPNEVDNLKVSDTTGEAVEESEDAAWLKLLAEEAAQKSVASGEGGDIQAGLDPELAEAEGNEPLASPCEVTDASEDTAWTELAADAVDPEPASPEAIAEAGDPWDAPDWEEAEADGLGGGLPAVDDEARENTAWLKFLADSAAAAGTRSDGSGIEDDRHDNGRVPADEVGGVTELAAWADLLNGPGPAHDEADEPVGDEPAWDPIEAAEPNMDGLSPWWAGAGADEETDALDDASWSSANKEAGHLPEAGAAESEGVYDQAAPAWEHDDPDETGHESSPTWSSLELPPDGPVDASNDEGWDESQDELLIQPEWGQVSGENGLPGTDGSSALDYHGAASSDLHLSLPPTPASAPVPAPHSDDNDAVTCSTEPGFDPSLLEVRRIDAPASSRDQPVTYGFIVRNTAPVALARVRVEHALPPGARCIGVMPKPETLDTSNTLIWHLGEMDAGAEQTFVVRVQKAPGIELPSETTAVFQACYLLKASVVRPRLIVTVTGPDNVRRGEPVVFEIVVKNAGSGPASEVVLSNLLPAGLQHPAGDRVEVRLGTIEPGEVVHATLSTTAVQAGPQVHAVVVSSDGGFRETGEASVLVTEAILSVRSAERLECLVDREDEYRVEIANSGTAPIADTLLIDSLPEEMEVLEVSHGGTYDAADRSITWAVGALAPGQARTFTVKFLAKLPGDFTHRMLAWSDCGLEAVFEGPIAAEIDQKESGHLLEELLATIDREDEEAASRPGRPGQAYPAPRRSGVAAGKQFVVFVLAGDEYAIPIGNVVEYGHPLAVTPVPNVPDWLLGVANVHGDILSMVDLRAFLGMERPDHGADGRMLVVRTSRDNISVGLIVDRVKGIRVIAEDVICLPTSPAEDRLAPYLRGVAEHQGRLVIFLNLDQLLLSSEMRQFEPV